MASHEFAKIEADAAGLTLINVYDVSARKTGRPCAAAVRGDRDAHPPDNRASSRSASTADWMARAVVNYA